jgi:predicted nuclease of restriction endonuclease-like (RecB) superfamily
VSQQLENEFGHGFSQPNLSRMTQLAEYFPDFEIYSTLSNKLSWSHFVELIRVKDDLKREFYAEMCRVESWSVRALRGKIQGMLFERTALSKKPDKVIRQELSELRDEDKLTPNLVFRDPYFLDFLGLKDTYNENDLESAILRELESFILELGIGFTFVARQFRMVIDGRDFHLDLLFYHRRLRRLVAIDLKLGEFEAAHKGQMELYLRWLERHEMAPGEESPLGLILCADKTQEQIELLRLDESGIHVAAYLTELPPIELLREKLHQAVADAQKLIENRHPEASDDL